MASLFPQSSFGWKFSYPVVGVEYALDVEFVQLFAAAAKDSRTMEEVLLDKQQPWASVIDYNLGASSWELVEIAGKN